MLSFFIRMVFPKYLFKTHICNQPLQPRSSNITSYVKSQRIILLTFNYKYSWICSPLKMVWQEYLLLRAVLYLFSFKLFPTRHEEIPFSPQTKARSGSFLLIQTNISFTAQALEIGYSKYDAVSWESAALFSGSLFCLGLHPSV